MISLRPAGLTLILSAGITVIAGCAGKHADPDDGTAVTRLDYSGSVPERTDLPPTVTTATTNPPPRTEDVAIPAASPAAVPVTNGAARASQPERPPARPAAVTRYVNATSLNVREAASAEARVLDQLSRGDKVSVRGEATDREGQRWSQIEYRDGGNLASGWVATNFLSTASVPVRDPAVRATAPRGESPAASTPPGPAANGDLAGLNYDPIPKSSYEGNPRVDARALYVSLNVLSSSRFEGLLKLLDETELNALVIDYKDDVGWLLTKSATAARMAPVANEKAKYADIADLIRKLKASNVYLIARIVTFKDPLFAKTHPEKAILNRRTGQVFKSEDGLSWASPHDRDFRDYNIGIAKEAAAAGFNEIQFDYIRFPDVPRTMDLDYRNTTGASKAQTIQNFLLEARRELAPLKVYLAADVFGLVTTTRDDMRIGQYWEAVANVVDYICPMMYPSHYANGSYGLGVPDQHPYELIHRGLRDALRRNGRLEEAAQIRPWLQSFTASWVKGHIAYGPQQVRAQIKAAADQGVRSYLMWHPSGKYNPAAYP